MLSNDQRELTISPATGSWTARHRDQPCGMPAEIATAGRPLVQDCGFYLDDLGSRQVVLQKRRSYGKAGGLVVEETGRFPFGNQVGFRQCSRYEADCLRVIFDLHWVPQTQIERHLGIGTMFLPGRWDRYYCIPPAQHLCEGAAAYTVAISDEDRARQRMVGHWHRPPLALVFHRDDGIRVEVGAGSDVWRWEQSLGAGPESGSYKIIAGVTGIQLVREPLMTCTPFTPQVQKYRFKWYLAWDRGHPAAGRGQPLQGTVFDLDLNPRNLPETGFRLMPPQPSAPPARAAAPCWLSPAVERELKRQIRRLAGVSGDHSLLVHKLIPGLCRDGAHLQRGRQGMLNHWDMDAIIDLGGWIRRQLGPGWQIEAADNHPWAQQLPSFSSLFQPGGF